MYQEYLNHLHASIEPLSSIELKDFLNNDDKLDEKIDEILEGLKAHKDSILDENRRKAESNIEKEPQIIELRGKVNELHAEGKSLCEAVQEKLCEMREKSGSMSQETALALLQTAAAQSEEETESLIQKFKDNELPVEGFLESFLSERKTMHLRKLKAEKMPELMRQQAAAGQPKPRGESAYNNLPGSNFYPPYPMSDIRMPMPPMPPMPSTRPY